MRGIPQSRVTCFAGPSGSGKSFSVCNTMREAQADGAFCLVIDSENALDADFMGKLGVKTDEDHLMYLGVVTIQDVTQVLSDFIRGYDKDWGRNHMDAPKVLIVLDSLDMLLTDGEDEKFEKGDQKGDQGQRTKLIKHLLRTVVSRVTRYPITFLCTHQVYKNQDITNGEGVWVVNNAVKYSASQIALFTKLKLKEDSKTVGIRMSCETYKSRFSQIGTKVEVEVPYEAGMDCMSGVFELLKESGDVFVQSGAWFNYTYRTLDKPPVKFYAKDFTEEMFLEILRDHPRLSQEESLVMNDDHDLTKQNETTYGSAETGE